MGSSGGACMGGSVGACSSDPPFCIKKKGLIVVY